MRPVRTRARFALAALAAVAAVTLVLGRWLHVSNAATVSTSYLMVVLLVAATSRLPVAVVTSVVAMLCLNFFFLPPVGTFTIADPQNWVALFAFLAVSLVASNLSAVARARTEEAVGRRDELARLFDLSRDVLMMTDSREALSVLARVDRPPLRSRVRRHRGAARGRLGRPSTRARETIDARSARSCRTRSRRRRPRSSSTPTPAPTRGTAR